MSVAFTYTTAKDLKDLIQIQKLQDKHHKDAIPKNYGAKKDI